MPPPDRCGFCFEHKSNLRFLSIRDWDGPMGTNGVSELLGVQRGRAVAIEVKAGKDKLTNDQRSFLERWSEAGGIGMEARDVNEVARELGIPLLL